MIEWFQGLFKKKLKNRLGIDLGSSAIKVVEIFSDRSALRLMTYGLAYFTPDDPTKYWAAGSETAQRFYIKEIGGQKETLFKLGPATGSSFEILSSNDLARIIRELLVRAQAKAKVCYFSVPSSATFSTLIKLPPMPEAEVAAAIPYEAKKYIPVPLEDVVLDWSIVSVNQEQVLEKGEPASPAKPDVHDKTASLSGAQIQPETIISSPRQNETGLEQVMEEPIAKSHNENVILEDESQLDVANDIPFTVSETEGLRRTDARSPAPYGAGRSAGVQEQDEIREKPAVIQVLVVAILKEAIEKYTQIARLANLDIRALEPENFSLARALIGPDEGLFVLLDLGSSFVDIILVKRGSALMMHSLKQVIDQQTNQINTPLLVSEINKVLNLYEAEFGQPKDIKCILTGGRIFNPGIVDSLVSGLKMEVRIGDPFSRVIYSSVLETTLKEIGPALSVATGLAMRD